MSQSYKIVYGEEIRRISFDVTPTWAEFQASIENILGAKLPLSLAKIQYQDEEGDLINISSEIEWNEALSVLAPNKLKRIIVTKKSSPEKKPATIHKRAGVKAKLPEVKAEIPEAKVQVQEVKSEVKSEPKIENIPQPKPQQSRPKALELPQELYKLEEINQEIKQKVTLVVDEIQRAMPYIMEEGCQVGSEIQIALNKIFSQGSDIGMNILRDGSVNAQTAFNHFMSQINIILPMLINGGLPMIKNFADNVLLNMRQTSDSAANALAHIDIFDKLDIAQILNKLAIILMRHNKVKESIGVLEVIVDNYPTNILALYNLACAYCKANKYPQSISALDRAIQCGFRDYVKIENDLDLAPLRGFEEFKAIVSVLKYEQDLDESQTGEDIQKEMEEFQLISSDEKSADNKSSLNMLPQVAPSIVPRPTAEDDEMFKYAEEIKMLNDMGFCENQVNLRMLIHHKGDLSAVISQLL